MGDKHDSDRREGSLTVHFKSSIVRHEDPFYKNDMVREIFYARYL